MLFAHFGQYYTITIQTVYHFTNNNFIIIPITPLHFAPLLVYNTDSQSMKGNIPNVLIASILAESAGQRKFAGLFSYLGTVRRWNLRILRAQDEIISFFKKAFCFFSKIIKIFPKNFKIFS
jgi:hypothetical protein